MRTIPFTTDDLSPEWFTAALRAAPQEHVVERQIQQLPYHASDPVFRVELQWSLTSRPEQPHSVVVKLGSSQRAVRGARELEIYRDAELMPAGLLPRAYFFACTEPAPDRYVLILEDLTTSHRTIDPQLPLSRPEAEQVVVALARLHAHWWHHPQLMRHAAENAWRYDHLRRHRFAISHLPQLVTALAGRAPQSVAVEAMQQLDWEFAWWQQRSLDHPENTLLHGDAHALNFLLPQDPTNSTYLIDWNPLPSAPCVGPAALDLAQLLIPNCTVSWRRQLETPILRHYHAALCQAGVQNYAWEQLWADYCRAATMQLHAVLQRANSQVPADWYLQWERVCTALNDLAANRAFA